MNIKKRILAVIIAFVVVLGSLLTLAASLYPYAVVVFSGIEMVKNGSTTQGFVDITLKNINTTGISFCLSYDKNYIELSNVTDNVPIQNPTVSDTTGLMTSPYNMEHTYFEQNTEAFPETPVQSFLDSEPLFISNLAPIIGVADADAGRLIMNFLPRDTAEPYSDYIEMVDNQPTIMADTPEGVRLGRISFNIKDRAAFSKLSDAELATVLQIIPFSEMDSVIVDETLDGNAGVQLCYINEEGDPKWHSHTEKNIDYEITISAKLSDVRADTEKITVSAYDIYNTGKSQDLLDFVNEKMSKLTLSYADGSKVPAVLEWNETESDLSSIVWNPKGGEYTLTQPYNGDFDVTVTVIVQPVTLVDFTTENMHETYRIGQENFPATFDELNLPQTARPVLSPYLYSGGIADVAIEWYTLEGETSQITGLPADFATTPQEYVFLGQRSAALDFASEYPWLTADPIPQIRVTRSVVDSEDAIPKTLTATASTDADGKLTIKVAYSDGSAIPEGTTFSIRMPGGALIDQTILTSLGERYKVEISGTAGATITIDPDPTVPAEQQLAAYINLGDRAGEFMIAAKESGEPQGAYVSFTAEERRNLYLPSSAEDGNYTFDYSEELSAMFPVKAGTSLPTTITLPLSTDRIGTTYDGENGAEPGALATFTVDRWNPLSGDLTTAGSVVTVTGTLADTAYTNYGYVYNDGKYTVTLSYLVVGNNGTDTIEPIADFVFNRQQVGYGYEKLQTQGFTVKNTGPGDIYGLTAVISLTTDKKEAFVVTKTLPQILLSGKSVTLDIKTTIGLPVGTHTATVSILSNNNTLDTFQLTFEVTAQPVFQITIIADDPSYGTAGTLSGTYTAQGGERIEIVAVPEEDCSFVGWFASGEGVTFVNSTAAETYFTMPQMDVEITAKFEETPAAYLRATDLLVMNSEETDDYPLYETGWVPTEFAPTTREYYVAVPSDEETVKLWFTPRDEAASATKTLTNTHGTAGAEITDTIAINAPEADQQYKSDPISLDVSPAVNKVVLSLSFPEDPDVVRTYTIYIYRKLPVSQLMTFPHGNSPFGLIMRDDGITDKDTAKQDFLDNGYSFLAGAAPEGATAGIPYTADAWGTGVNYDLNETALFVDTTESFVDTGYERVQNSIGDEVYAVDKSVNVNVLAETDPTLQTGSADDFVYITSQTIALPSDGEITQLQSIRIRPDVYQLTYSFTDFDGSTVSIQKPLILLTALGNVNVSDKADAEDVSRIMHRFSTGIANQHNVPNYAGGALFKYRVCDVNKDGNLNAIDANFVRAAKITPFYNNEGGGG